MPVSMQAYVGIAYILYSQYASTLSLVVFLSPSKRLSISTCLLALGNRWNRGSHCAASNRESVTAGPLWFCFFSLLLVLPTSSAAIATGPAGYQHQKARRCEPSTQHRCRRAVCCASTGAQARLLVTRNVSSPAHLGSNDCKG